MWLVAFLYSPAVDSLEDLQFKQARKEHEHIMNQFYEQELPDISSQRTAAAAGTTLELSTTLQTEEGEVKGGASSGGPEKRNNKRFMKKDKQEKAKEKLWESIIKETEDEASDSSEDEDHI